MYMHEGANHHLNFFFPFQMSLRNKYESIYVQILIFISDLKYLFKFREFNQIKSFVITSLNGKCAKCIKENVTKLKIKTPIVLGTLKFYLIRVWFIQKLIGHSDSFRGELAVLLSPHWGSMFLMFLSHGVSFSSGVLSNTINKKGGSVNEVGAVIYFY